MTQEEIQLKEYQRRRWNGLIAYQKRCPKCKTPIRLSEDAEWYHCEKCGHWEYTPDVEF